MVSEIIIFRYLRIFLRNIKLCCDFFTNGHSKLGSDISVHHIYYQEGYFRQTNGEKIGTFESLPISIKETDKIYDANTTGVRAWIWDIALNKNNNPVITYARYPDEHNHEYYYTQWNGSKWIDKRIINSGSYTTIRKTGKKVFREFILNNDDKTLPDFLRVKIYLECDSTLIN